MRASGEAVREGDQVGHPHRETGCTEGRGHRHRHRSRFRKVCEVLEVGMGVGSDIADGVEVERRPVRDECDRRRVRQVAVGQQEGGIRLGCGSPGDQGRLEGQSIGDQDA